MKNTIILLSVISISLAGFVSAACPQADITGDCKVDLEDFAIMASEWLTESHPDPNNMVFVDIPAGTFQMGDSFSEGNSDELPVHTVTLNSFKMSKYEITNSQFADFLNSAYPEQIKVVDGIVYAVSDISISCPYFSTSSAPSGYFYYGEYSQIDFTDDIFSVRSKSGRDMSNDPVVNVSWYGAKAFCDYYGYRLPTEAEWEYAARGGLSGNRFPWGNTINHNYVNYKANGSQFLYDTSPYTSYTFHPSWNNGLYPYTSPVGSFPANGYGLHDMIGNVNELCEDWYSSSYYSSSPENNPTGPTTGDYRVNRGGSWYINAYGCRVAKRSYGQPYVCYYRTGFRVCLKPQADVNGDLKVNLLDFAIMASEWLEVGEPLPVLNGLSWVPINDPGVDDNGDGVPDHEPFNGEMSKFEITNFQYCEFLNTALAYDKIYITDNFVYGRGGEYPNRIFFLTFRGEGCKSRISYDGISFSVIASDGNDFSNHPVTMVSWYGAMAFCKHYGYRLPTEWEWQAVADFDGSYIYGCGLTIDETKANYGKPHSTTSRVGNYTSYGYGMNDMAGNVWEWTSSIWNPTDGKYILRGGSWFVNDIYCTVTNRYYHYDISTHPDIGFRVCR